MKIAVIASLYRPYARGGAEIVAQTIIDELKKEHEVIVITLSPWKGFFSLFPKIAREDGVRVVRFFPKNIFSFIDIEVKPFFLRLVWHICDMLNIHSAWTVWSILCKEKPDIVMMHAIKGMGYMVPFAVRAFGVPHLFTVHDVQFAVPSGQYMHGQESRVKASFALKMYRALTRYLLGSPQCVVFPSQFLKDFYEGYGFFKTSKRIVLQNPIQQCMMNALSALYGHEPVRFLYLGQLEQHKGILFLLDTFQTWNDQDAQLMIAGKGSCEGAVSAACLADARISYAGYVSGCEREELFEGAHFVIVPSLCYENAPLVVGEALCRGIPAIAPRIGGAHERIRPGENGFLFEPHDTRDCLSALSAASDAARARYAELSRSARESVQEFTVERYCKKIFGFL